MIQFDSYFSNGLVEPPPCHHTYFLSCFHFEFWFGWADFLYFFAGFPQILWKSWVIVSNCIPEFCPICWYIVQRWLANPRGACNLRSWKIWCPTKTGQEDLRCLLYHTFGNLEIFPILMEGAKWPKIVFELYADFYPKAQVLKEA